MDGTGLTDDTSMLHWIIISEIVLTRVPHDLLFAWLGGLAALRLMVLIHGSGEATCLSGDSFSGSLVHRSLITMLLPHDIILNRVAARLERISARLLGANIQWELEHVIVERRCHFYRAFG